VSLSYALMRFDSTIDPLPNVPALTNPCSSPGPQGGGGPPVFIHSFSNRRGTPDWRCQGRRERGATAASPGEAPPVSPCPLLPTPPDRQDIYSIHFHCPATARAPEPHPIHSETFFWAAGHKKTDCLQRTLCGHKKTDRSHELNNV
jgi:hypothetical protein